MEVAEGYILELGLDANDEIIGYKFVHLGKMMEQVKKVLTLKKLMKRISELTADLMKPLKKVDPRKE